MITKRIIPCLDVKNGRVVKGTNFLGLRDVSSPVELARKEISVYILPQLLSFVNMSELKIQAAKI